MPAICSACVESTNRHTAYYINFVQDFIRLWGIRRRREDLGIFGMGMSLEIVIDYL